MTITETLRRLAEKVGGPLETEWVADVQMYLSKCTPATILALVAVVEAVREMRDATRKYERVTAENDYEDFGVQWQEASREHLQTKRDLDAALEALAGVEG